MLALADKAVLEEMSSSTPQLLIEDQSDDRPGIESTSQANTDTSDNQVRERLKKN